MHIGQTDTTSVKCLINSISRFILLVSCQTLKPMPLQKICNNMVGVLKRLKPVLDDVMDHQIPLDESLRKECEKLDMWVNEARDFIEKWGPKMSKIHSVLQSGTLLIKLQSTSLDICHMIVKSLQSPPSASVLANLQNYIQELQCLRKETAMVHIEEAMRNQRDNIEPSNEHLKEIIELLKLTSNEELMKESIAVEKQILNAEANKMKVDLEEIDEIVNLILNLRDYVMKTECPVIKSGVSVPSYFRCPLSLELMLDPVIVASGQTYERQSIQKWLDHGLTVCPKTRLRLTHTNLIPNYTVKAMIANWCEENNVKLSGYSEHNNSSHITSHSDYLLDQDLAHACGFGSVPSTKSILTSSPLTGNAFEKQKGDNSFRLHGEHNGCQSGPTEKCEQQSPYNDSESRSESFSSSISSTELVLAVSKDVSGISNKHQTVTGEITNVNSSSPGNKQSGISHWLSGKQFQSHGSNVGGIENGSYSYNSNTNNSCSRVDSHHVFNSGSDELATSSHVDKLVEDLQSQSIEVQPIATVSKEVSGISDKHQIVKASSGGITNVYPASTGISGKQFQSPANGNKNNNSNTENNHSRVDSHLVSNSGSDELTTSSHVNKLIEDLHSQSIEVQTTAAEELRLLTKHNMENRVIVGKCGAVIPLLSLLYSDVKITQEHAVTALLNLSINEDNKTLIMEAGALEPLIHVLKTGNDGAKENSAATLFSLSVIENNKEKIGRSGAIKALVDLLASGTLRGKKDAATALFNLSIFHENKARIVQAGGVKFLARLMDPADGMVDKAVALLSNLSTITEGRIEIVREGGIPLLVEVLETGTQRGKENAASIILQLCLHSTKFCTMVLQEGAVPPLVALSQSGTPRAKEKAQQLLSHFRNQREGATGKGKS